jgi:hypothetical protein
MYVSEKGIRPVTGWLYTGIFLVFTMILVGAITRLTESGLSITEWNVVTGTLPPLSAEDWHLEFEKYKKTPEYVDKNRFHFGEGDEALDNFKKNIFLGMVPPLSGAIYRNCFSDSLLMVLEKRVL